MTNEERLQRYLDHCRLVYDRMQREGAWPWHDTQKQAAHAKMDADPVLLFDNSSTGSDADIELMTVAGTAAFLGISKSGVRRLQQARQLAFIKVGNSVRFTRRDLITYLWTQRVEPIDP